MTEGRKEKGRKEDDGRKKEGRKERKERNGGREGRKDLLKQWSFLWYVENAEEKKGGKKRKEGG